MSKPKKYFPGWYVLGLISVVGIILVIASMLFCWLRYSTWSTIIPYSVNTTILDKADFASSVTVDSSTLALDVVIDNSDIDALYEKLEDHIDSYLTFSITLLSLVLTAVCVVVPLFNYVFIQKDTVESFKKYAAELHAEQDDFVKTLQEKQEKYEKELRDKITENVKDVVQSQIKNHENGEEALYYKTKFEFEERIRSLEETHTQPNTNTGSPTLVDNKFEPEK